MTTTGGTDESLKQSTATQPETETQQTKEQERQAQDQKSDEGGKQKV